MQLNSSDKPATASTPLRLGRWGTFWIAWCLIVLVLSVRFALIGQVNRQPISPFDAFAYTLMAWMQWPVCAYCIGRWQSKLQELGNPGIVGLVLIIGLLSIAWYSAAQTVLLPRSLPYGEAVIRNLLPELIWHCAIAASLLFWLPEPPKIDQRLTDRPRFLQVRSGNQLLQIAHEDIVSIQAQDYYAAIITTLQTHLVREPVYKLAEKLKQHGFYRVNRSSIVPLKSVKSVGRHPEEGLCIELNDGNRLKLGRQYRKAIETALSDTS